MDARGGQDGGCSDQGRRSGWWRWELCARWDGAAHHPPSPSGCFNASLPLPERGNYFADCFTSLVLLVHPSPGIPAQASQLKIPGTVSGLSEIQQGLGHIWLPWEGHRDATPSIPPKGTRTPPFRASSPASAFLIIPKRSRHACNFSTKKEKGNRLLFSLIKKRVDLVSG